MPPPRTLDQELSILDPNLVKVFKAIAKGIAFIAVRVATVDVATILTTTDHRTRCASRPIQPASRAPPTALEISNCKLMCVPTCFCTTA